MRLQEIIEELKPIAKQYGLRLNRKKEFDQARKIKNNIDSKVTQLLYRGGVL